MEVTIRAMEEEEEEEAIMTGQVAAGAGTIRATEAEADTKLYEGKSVGNSSLEL